MMYEPSFTRDCLVLGLCIAVFGYVCARIGYALAKAKFYRSGWLDGAGHARLRMYPRIFVSPKAPAANGRN